MTSLADATTAVRTNISPWVWSFLAAAAAWLLMWAVSGRGATQTLSLALALSPFLVLVSLGQMLVITLGPGNIDLSVGWVMSLAGFVSVSVSADTGSALLGLVAGLAVGLPVAASSVVLILAFRVPPIIATLAAGMFAASATLAYAEGFQAAPHPTLRAFLGTRLAGLLPLSAILAAAITVGVVLLLTRTVFGRSLIAIGQNRAAAALSGIRVKRGVAITYLASAAFAGLAGALLGAYVAPSVQMGTRFMLDSIAVAVIGGTLLAGGRPVPLGVWGGSLFFILLNNLVALLGWGHGERNLLKGALILLVLVIASEKGPSHEASPTRQ